MIKNLSFFLIFLVLVSCTKSKPKNPHIDFFEAKKDTLHLVFSHNINGETHPCGCRHFPLGGLPQVAGKLNELRESGEVYLLDTGDMLFPSPNLPPTMQDSFTFGAKNLSKGMDLLGLKYFVPGDQDFALGTDFLANLLKESKYKLLVSNFKSSVKLPHKKAVIIEKGDQKVFLIGLVDPTVLPEKEANKFESTEQALTATMLELKKLGFDEKNPKHRLILLSHSGMPNDQTLVKKFPAIDWVLGAHSQSFTKIPYEEGNTRLAQVLSRNHYLGEVKIDFKEAKDSWQLHEIRDELKDQLKPNPFEEFITKHKEEIKRIQIQEQSALGLHAAGAGEKYKTPNSCTECHQPQVDFWNETPHSIAWATLINANEDKNLTCVGCHSVGFQSPSGFMIPDKVIIFDKESYEIEKTEEMSFEEKDNLEAKKLAELKSKYWSDISAAFKGIDSIRKLPKNKIVKLSKMWMKKDLESKVTHNFANVQCLNCHSELHGEHPFAIPPEISAQAKFEKMKENCLNCHVPDQSPEWYEVQENGKPGRAKDELVKKMIEKLSCPKNES